MSLPPTSASNAAPSADQRSAAWFAEQIHVHDSGLKSYLCQSFPSARQEVEDLVQESYLRVWEACAHRPLSSARAFLFKVARHVALDFLRRTRASPIDIVGDVAALPILEERRGVAETVSIDEKIRLLAQGLATLPTRGRQVVILRKFKCLSQQEVAAQLGISSKTVDEHLARGMKRLGEYLRAHGVTSHYDR